MPVASEEKDERARREPLDALRDEWGLASLGRAREGAGSLLGRGGFLRRGRGFVHGIARGEFDRFGAAPRSPRLTWNPPAHHKQSMVRPTPVRFPGRISGPALR